MPSLDVFARDLAPGLIAEHDQAIANISAMIEKLPPEFVCLFLEVSESDDPDPPECVRGDLWHMICDLAMHGFASLVMARHARLEAEQGGGA